MKRFTHCRGFTLIELLLVLVILSVLASIVTVQVAKYSEKARHDGTKADIRSLETALETFRLDNGRYPSSGEGLTALIARPPDLERSWTEKYVKEIPLDKWGRPYRYEFPAADDPSTYTLYSAGKDGLDHTEDDVTRYETVGAE